MEKQKIIALGLWVSIAMLGLLTFVFLQAYLSEEKAHMITVNDYGEGTLELFIVLPLTWGIVGVAFVLATKELMK